MLNLELLNCNICGGELTPLNENTFRCVCCGNLFARKQENLESALKKTLGEEKYARVSAARQNLWRAMHEEYVNSEACVSYARELKSYIPSDYYANFAEVANGNNDRELSKFLNESSGDDMKIYGDAVLDFMLKQGAMTPSTVTAVCSYINRAYPIKTSPEYIKYINKYEEEVANVDEGMYDLTIPRDVFIAYSSADIGLVTELCEYLESQEISCFTSMRNLRHGRGAADNYDRALNAAIDSCRIIVFVSSENARKLGCEALRKELPRVRQKDLDGAPAELRKSYEKLHVKYKKERVEYLIDDYGELTPADKKVKEFFSGYEWCVTKEDVADRVYTYLISEPEGDDDSKSDATAQNINEETIQKIITDALAKSESKRREEEEKRIREAEEKAERERQEAAERRKKEEAERQDRERREAEKAEKERQEAEERRKREEAERIEREKRESAEKSERERQEAEERKKKEEDERREAEERRKREESERIEREKREAAERERIEEERRQKAQEKYLQELAERGIKVSDDLDFEFENGYTDYTVTGIGDCTDKDIVIPAIHNGLPVTAIENSAFRGCATFESIVIPDSVKSIGTFAFSNCIALVSVEIGNGVTTIGMCAFSGCSLLGSLIIPNSVTSISRDAFWDCESLKSISLSCRITSIETDTFRNCTSLEHIDIPNGVTSIGREAFEGCSSLDNIVIPNSVTEIGNDAFSGCKSLKTISIPNNLKELKSSLFFDCSSLTSVIIPSSITSIGAYAFSCCTSVKNITLPEELKMIGEGTFLNCESLREITIPDGVKFIGKKAFYGCDKLKRIIFKNPDGWKQLGRKNSSGDLLNPVTAATLLTNSEDTWKRTE